MANTNHREIIGTESQDESHAIDRLLLKIQQQQQQQQRQQQ